jgi:hypothetical protein
MAKVSVFRCLVSGVRVQKNADRLESYKAGKLESAKASRLSGLLSFRL